MGLFKKILAGGLGWTLGGPIGAIIGVVIASMMDAEKENQRRRYLDNDTGSTSSPHSQYTSRSYVANDFQMALLVLIAAVMKADGNVIRSELDTVKRILVANFGEQGALEALQILKNLLQQDIDPYTVARQCAMNMTYSMRLQLLHILYDLAAVDGEVNPAETNILTRIAANMQISQEDMASILAMFTKQSNPQWAYNVLEIPATATDDEVKKAYRRMAMKYHPDKVATLGEEAKQTATEKFRQVKEAYDSIKRQRNLQ